MIPIAYKYNQNSNIKYLVFQKITMWEIDRVINCYDTSLEDEVTVVYLPTGFLKGTDVYFDLLMLKRKGYCRALSYCHPYRLHVLIHATSHFVSAAEISLFMA